MNIIATAFPNVVHDSQTTFRKLLKAMSEPGTAITLDRCAGFGSLPEAATQLLLALADNSTPLWFSPTLMADKSAIANLNFHISAPLNNQQNANFAVISLQDSYLQQIDFSQFNMGTAEYPDLSSTVVIETDCFNEGPVLTLTGPGIKHQRQIQLGNLPESMQTILLQHNQHFPLGIDMVFVCGQQAISIARTTNVEF